MSVSGIDFHEVFINNPVPQLVLAADSPLYTVLDVNPSYLTATRTTYENLIGRPIFEAFPANPERLDLKNVERTIHSFERAIQTKKADIMPEFQFDIPVPGSSTFEERHWTAINTPILDTNNRVKFLVQSSTDVTEKVKVRLALEESEAKFRFMAEFLPQQVWTANDQGKLEFVNNWTLNYFGKSDWQITGENWTEYIHPDDLEQCLKAWGNSVETGALYEMEFRLFNADKNYRWHLSRALPFKNNDRIIKWLGTNTDIEDHKQLEQRKDEFISIASHELKTPMTTLKGYMQLLAMNELTERNRLFVEKSLNQVSRIENLISDLLDASKITSGHIEYNLSRFRLDDLIHETVRDMSLTAATHSLQIRENSATEIEGDRYRIAQVIINFLTNAVKYSPDADHVVIESKLLGEKIVVSIQDFGIGINSLHDGMIYDRYYRVDQTAMLYSGMGLGLYVNSQIVNRHSGEIWYTSKPGIGSIFYFSLPLPAQA